MDNWARKPLLLTLQKLNSKGYIIDALLAMIISNLAHHSQIEDNQIAAKLVCFGADDISSF